ncbi:ubiquitin carboxyl-terminal hydrolase 6 [Rhizoctonia solani AG-1 IA]|uniref:Ubiquitin carboxyl-terminal hydrolase n=1 Tax=Thanatephorus cucumeris (strain AG1-IA) TaxID=983506 RepID=L8WPH7_THACA|nr:ubiquitin carboxyl-terminal hydrolase 6 [Rhizoctonia solani AG-1 IA]
MSAFTVHIKHGGKQQSLQLDPEQPPSVFKEAIYQVTGVPVDRMKVMIKGALLKDDSSWKGVNPKGQTFTVIGTAGPLPKPPSTPVQFLEDMDERELASVSKTPVGLQNLGNTCYMNSTVQALRAIPELQTALDPVTGTPTTAQHRLAMALRETYKAMGKTTEGFPPLILLTHWGPESAGRISAICRTNERWTLCTTRYMHVLILERGTFYQRIYSDAEECWSQMISAMKTQVPGLTNGSGSASKSFIEQYMVGEMRKVLKSVEDTEEPESVSVEEMLKINCNISSSTNYMHSGIKESLDEVIEKHSERLGRTAKYKQTSRISRLPSNLTVHMVRFYWRRDINKKAKIMRKVKFPFEFDALDLLTDELREKIQPATRKLLEIEGDRLERRRARRKLKNKSNQPSGSAPPETNVGSSGENPEPEPMSVDEPRPGDIEDEATAREREKAAIDAVIDPEVRGDTGAAVHALFELTAIVTHKGASADGGHYIGWVRKSALETLDESAPEGDKEEWYKFDDDKVSVVTREKISTLDGGGEDSTAYLLLYRGALYKVSKIHMCKTPILLISRTIIDAAPSSDSRQANAYLDAHNSFRAQHAADPLTWSTKLETKAQGWANGCRFKHGSTGENLAVGTGDFGAAAAVKLWTDEIGKWLRQSNPLQVITRADQYDPNNPQPSHFTQVVWKSTTELGCAVTRCPAGTIYPQVGAMAVQSKLTIGNFCSENVQK